VNVQSHSPIDPANVDLPVTQPIELSYLVTPSETAGERS